MTRTIRILTLLAVMVITAGQAWAEGETAYAVLTGEDSNKTLTFKYEVHTVSGSNEWDATNTGTSQPWENVRGNITKVVFDPSFADARPKSCYQWFRNCNKLTTIEGLENLNTSEVTDMNSMFYDCKNLTSLDVSHFNTSIVTDMQSMFYYCTSLTSLDVSNFNTSKVTNMSWMFYGCSSLTSLDVSHFDTRNVTKMDYMFQYCSGLKSLDLSNFDTGNVTSMSGMFQNCSSLTSLDVSHFNTSNVTDMSWMFYGCSSLTSLDVSHFDTRNVTDMHYMFLTCKKLTSLDLSTFNTGKVNNMNGMFKSCEKLKSLSIGEHFRVKPSGTDKTTQTQTDEMFFNCTALADGQLILMVMGTAAPSIEQDIFNVYTNGTLITNLTKEQLGITETATPYTWKGGTFKSVGGASVDYLDENREIKTATDALPITASCTTNLSAGWYYVEGHVSLNHYLEFNNDAHLILCDGAELTVEYNNNTGIVIVSSRDLAIYGQGGTPKTDEAPAISEGKLIAFGGQCGISANQKLTINGGQVTVTGSDVGISTSDNFTINGGQVEATGGDYGIYADNCNIILGLTNATDYIKASSYNAGNGNEVKTAANKPMIAYTPAASENDSEKQAVLIQGKEGGVTLNDFARSALGGKVLRPADAKAVSVSYMDWNDTQKKLVEKNTATDENTDNDIVYVLQGTEEYLGEKTTGSKTVVPDRWYICNSTLSWNKQLDLYDNIHLILADGAKMSVTGDYQAILSYYKGNIAIYGQSGATGTLTTKSNNGYGIHAYDGNITINGAVISSTNSNSIYTEKGDIAIYDCKVTAEKGGRNIYTKQGDVTITGGEVTVTDADHAIYTDGGNVTISDCKATLTGIGSSGIWANKATDLSHGNITITNSEVTATSTNGDFGLYAVGDVTINDSKVTAETEWFAIAAGGAQGITINGGEVTATASSNAGMKAFSGDITLGWNKATDFIKASSYKVDNGSVKIPAGKALVIDGTTTILGGDADYIFGSGTNKTLDDIANQTLRASKDFPVSAGAQYAVICQNQGDWKITDPDVKMYVPTGNIILNATTGAYEMELREVTDGGIPNGMPIIVAKEGGLDDIPVVGTTATEANTIETNYTNANPSPTFFAADGEKTLNELINNALGAEVDPNDYVAFTLIGGKLVAASNSGNIVNAGTCIFVVSKFDVLRMVQGTYTAPASSAPGIVIDLGEVTGVREVNASLEVKDDSFYTLDGRKLDKRPTEKGVYINKGNKVVIR